MLYFFIYLNYRSRFPSAEHLGFYSEDIPSLGRGQLARARLKRNFENSHMNSDWSPQLIFDVKNILRHGGEAGVVTGVGSNVFN